jgi:CheY-like chemotaxis protein
MSGPGIERSAEGFAREPAKGGPVNHALLYIEDDESNIALVEAVLRRRPHIELHVARNGRDGVRAATGTRPGLILLDNRLPDATGREILRELTSTPATARIPVVVLSSDSGDLIDELLAHGATESVPKPFDINQFMSIIDRYLPGDPELASPGTSAPPSPASAPVAVKRLTPPLRLAQPVRSFRLLPLLRRAEGLHRR